MPILYIQLISILYFWDFTTVIIKKKLAVKVLFRLYWVSKIIIFRFWWNGKILKEKSGKLVDKQEQKKDVLLLLPKFKKLSN